MQKRMLGVTMIVLVVVMVLPVIAGPMASIGMMGATGRMTSIGMMGATGRMTSIGMMGATGKVAAIGQITDF